MQDIKQLRREAERLRRQANMPLPRETFEQLGAVALHQLIRDARAKIKERQYLDSLSPLDALLDI